MAGIPPEFSEEIEELTALDEAAERDPALHSRRVALAERILARLPEGGHPWLQGALLYNLGNAYSDVPAGDRGTNLERAIAAYTEALRFRTAEAAPREYAATQYNLALTYTELPTGNRGANLERAIAAFKEALRFRTAEAAPREYAATQYNLALTYTELPTGNRGANLERAIAAYTEALRIYTPEAAPLDYAGTQHNLGTAYVHLLTGNRGANLERAIACFTEALRFYTPETAPLDYALTQNNLGYAYAYLLTGDRVVNLVRAITCFTEALRFYTAEVAPLGYGMVQHNLGLAYGELPTGDRAVNLERAIGCYSEALRFRTAEAAPLEYAATQTSLGSAYRGLPTGDRAANVERAIACYTEALRFHTAEAAPLEYAMAQHNLGLAYWELPTGDREANLERAIVCIKEALRFRTAEAVPLAYAGTQTDLGNAYAELSTGDRESNVRRAIACYTEALRFYTGETAPGEHRMTAANLGDLHFAEGRFGEAHAAFASAVAAGELLYRATATELGREVELSEAGDVVASDAYSLARLGRGLEAVERLEGGRTRALAEALARDRVALGEAREEDREAYVVARDRIRALEAEARAGGEAESDGGGGRSFLELSSALAAARGELDVVVARIRGYLPHFMAEGLTYPEIAAAATPDRPLAYLLTTSRGSVALIVTAGSEHFGSEQVVWLDGFNGETLDGLLVERDEGGAVAGGYLVGQLGGDMNTLGAALGRMLPLLGEELVAPLAGALADLGVSQATLVAVGRLSLLPLPATAPGGLTFSLAPSARALGAARDAAADRARLAPVLVGVGNPLPVPEGLVPLDYAAEEVAAIASRFEAGSRRLHLEDRATLDGVTGGLAGATHLHLACHGSFDPDQPLDSALYLAGGERITLGDLLDGDLDLSTAQLAVLSACQTGITEFDRIPDEAVGLPAGFLQAGVPGVVATLWSVNDLSTALLMAEFYRLLLTEHLDPATALHRARGWLGESTATDLHLAESFDRRHQTSGWTDTAALNTARYYHAHPDDRPFADPTHWAGYTYTGP